MLKNYTKGKKTAMDMGCGAGVFSFLMAKKGLDVTGIDASSDMLTLCNKRKAELGISNVQFIHGDVTRLDVLSIKPTDVIISSSVLEYIEDIENTIRSFYDLLNDKGILIFSLPNADCLYRKLERRIFKLRKSSFYYRYVKHVVTINDITPLLRNTGFTILEHQYFGHGTIVNKLTKTFGLPRQITGNMFVMVLQK